MSPEQINEKMDIFEEEDPLDDSSFYPPIKMLST